jgi:hypothetical protein
MIAPANSANLGQNLGLDLGQVGWRGRTWTLDLDYRIFPLRLKIFFLYAGQRVSLFLRGSQTASDRVQVQVQSKVKSKVITATHGRRDGLDEKALILLDEKAQPS